MKTTLRSYLETAFWSSNDIDTERSFETLGFTPDDASKDLIHECQVDLDAFEALASENGIDLHYFPNWPHDFWLTRNRHGAGFWDGNYPIDIGKKLTDLSHLFSEVNLLLSDNGEIDQL